MDTLEYRWTAAFLEENRDLFIAFMEERNITEAEAQEMSESCKVLGE